jgi:hypothetical protein
MPGFSPSKSLKGDPNMYVVKCLEKHGQTDLLDVVNRWMDLEPGSPSSLKKHFIVDNAIDDEGRSTADYHSIDLKDPMTWGSSDLRLENMPSDQFFVELFKAIKQDEKRRAKRASYEF